MAEEMDENIDNAAEGEEEQNEVNDEAETNEETEEIGEENQEGEENEGGNEGEGPGEGAHREPPAEAPPLRQQAARHAPGNAAGGCQVRNNERCEEGSGDRKSDDGARRWGPAGEAALNERGTGSFRLRPGVPGVQAKYRRHKQLPRITAVSSSF